MPRLIEPRVFVQETCLLGEGVFWFEDRVWWVDIDAGKLHSTDADGGDRQIYDMGRRIGAAAPVDHRRFVVALEDGVGIFDRESRDIEIFSSPEKGMAGSRFNDGKCDPEGRFLAGTLNMNGVAKASALYSFDGAGTWRKLYAPATLSNGLAWSTNGQTLYYIDTPTLEIVAFSYDLRTGELGNVRTVVRVPRECGYPDGMTIDETGKLWVAHWGGGAVRCWCPESGECLAEIRVPCLRPTCCSFGGENLDRLFITSARTGGSAEDPAKHPLSGSVFVCEPGAHGRPVNVFRWKGIAPQMPAN